MNTQQTQPKNLKTTRSNGLYAIMQKELKRFFTDTRMIFTVVLLPGLMIYLIYSFIGIAMTSNLTVDSTYVPQVYAVNLPNEIAAPSSTMMGLDFQQVGASEIDAIKERIAAKEADLLVVFPVDFYERVSDNLQSGNYHTGWTGGQSADQGPTVQLYYNSTRMESSDAFGKMQYLLSIYKESLQPTFSMSISTLASQEDTVGFLFSSLLPLFLMIFLFTGCISVAPESIAGEKERGTIATLLVTPLKRWELALGKILSLCIIALLAGASSFLGVMLSLSNILKMSLGDSAGDFSLLSGISFYSIQDYLMLLAVIFSTVLVFIGLISIISAYAKNTKEANTMVMPLMVVVMLVAASAMFQASSTAELPLFLIPVYNSVQSLVSIFSFSAEALPIILTVSINAATAGLCVLALTYMFESERVVFSK